jgi:hypothetical protein
MAVQPRNQFRSEAIRGSPTGRSPRAVRALGSLGYPLRLGSPGVARSSTPLGLPLIASSLVTYRVPRLQDVPVAGAGDWRPPKTSAF